VCRFPSDVTLKRSSAGGCPRYYSESKRTISTHGPQAARHPRSILFACGLSPRLLPHLNCQRPGQGLTWNGVSWDAGGLQVEADGTARGEPEDRRDPHLRGTSRSSRSLAPDRGSTRRTEDRACRCSSASAASPSSRMPQLTRVDRAGPIDIDSLWPVARGTSVAARGSDMSLRTRAR
jgi:hypothetical protein